MRPLSRAARGQAYAQQLEQGHCGTDPQGWRELERSYDRARTKVAREAVLRQVNESFCSGCPAFEGCAEQANVTGYTGLAAGAAYVDGRRKAVASGRRDAPMRSAS